MKKRLAIIVILGATIFIHSCKKKETTPDPVVNNTPVTPPADGSPSSATQFYGIFTAGVYTTISSPTSSNVNVNGKAYFSNQAVPGVYSGSAVQVNKVYLNNDTLSYNSLYKYYTLYNNVDLTTETWSVSGANGISSFSFTNNTAITPSCTGLNNLPDSISKSAGFTITINNISNFTNGSVLVFDGTGNTNGYYSAPLNAGNNTIVISSLNLSTLVSGNSNALIGVVLSNNKAFVFGGKDFRFVREAQYNKHFKIKP